MTAEPSHPEIKFEGKLTPTTISKSRPEEPLILTVTATLEAPKPITIWSWRTVFDVKTALAGELEIVDAETEESTFYVYLNICGPILNGVPMDWTHEQDFVELQPGKPFVFDIDFARWRVRRLEILPTLDDRVEVGRRYRIRFRRDVSPREGMIRCWAWGGKSDVLMSKTRMLLGHKAPLSGTLSKQGQQNALHCEFANTVEFHVSE